MNLRSLAIFTAVCEEKNMTAAARRLHLAQPSVSLAIRELETEYDCVFFERLSKRLYLTEAGQRFYAYAQRILALQEEMDVCFHERTYERQLRIGSSITIASTVLFPLLHDFCQQHPAVQLHTKVLSTYTVESAVLDNQLDLALIEGTPRNDALTVSEIEGLNPSHIILSPGPGYPKDAGICEEVVSRLGGSIPILGVCLGHQAICEAFGGRIEHAQQLMHGKQSIVEVDTEEPLFKGLAKKAMVARYHSLVAAPDSLPECLKVISRDERGEIMAVRHKTMPIYGVQFHPESILTPQGTTIMQNFLKMEN